MKRTLARFLSGAVPGACFLVAGILDNEYAISVLGGVLLIGSIYGLARGHMTNVGASDEKRQRRSLVFAGVIGVSLAVVGFINYRYVLASGGTVISIGSLMRLYWASLIKGLQ